MSRTRYTGTGAGTNTETSSVVFFSHLPPSGSIVVPAQGQGLYQVPVADQGAIQGLTTYKALEGVVYCAEIL